MSIFNQKKIVVFGATSTIGKAVVTALSPKYQILQVGNHQGQFQADLADPDSIGNVFKAIGRVDGIISTAGAARFKPLEKLTDEDFRFSLRTERRGGTMWRGHRSVVAFPRSAGLLPSTLTASNYEH